MKGWADGIQDAIQYMEDNLTEELSIEAIAARAYVSAFHFQRIFSSLCGVTVGEYIRCRRLTLAAQELTSGKLKVIDAAVKYGYDSADSFSRAFTKFHGISPSAAKEQGMYGICIDDDGKNFDYLIADDYTPAKEVPEGYQTRVIPAGTWAIFPCKLKTLQQTNTQMWSEWLPNCKGYELAGNYNIEMYTMPEEKVEESYCEIWLPVKKI